VASIYKRYRVKVSGIVQGVGFRPFVYQLARELGLSGFVFNDGDGVVVEIEGEELSIQRFKEKLRTSPPTLSRIDSVDEQEVAVLSDTGFVIQESKQSSAETMVSPDIAVCDACREEMNDISNRRYHYPFINCTDCGPRYSIIESLPYDRPNTSMAAFSMCEACAKEYNDPNDRRYHAQPISCHDCGPRVSLLDLDGSVLAQDIEAVNRLCSLILHGKTVAIKGLGGFHLVCDATNEEAVAQLRRDKRRPTKPLAVMFDTIENAKRVSCLSDAEELLLCSKEHPIVVVQKNDENLLAPSVAPGIDRVGLFLAYTPLHILLLEKLGRPIVATSANLSDEPIITDEKTLLNTTNQTGHSRTCCIEL
jgi:hydrogenase maturation protein HypF